MATPIAAMTHCPLIPIVPYTVQCNQQTISLSCKVNEGTQNVPCYVNCKEKALFSDQADTKYILHTIKEFTNVCTTDHLTITTSPLSFHFLHQVVRELSKHQSASCLIVAFAIARFASLSCYSSAKTRIQLVKSCQINESFCSITRCALLHIVYHLIAVSMRFQCLELQVHPLSSPRY